MAKEVREITIESQWSDNLTSAFIEDFISVYQLVFDPNEKDLKGWFSRKYIHNPMGASLISIAYIEGKPVGIDVMWRNDVNGNLAYQTVDTGTLESYRGMGVFRKITEKELSILGNGSLIYGFPNPNSYPGYVKFGWKIFGCKRTALFTGIASYEKIYKEDASYEYVRWYFLEGKKKIYHTEKCNQYFIITPTRIKGVYHIISRVDKKTASLFKKACGRVAFLVMSRLSTRIPRKYTFLPLIGTSDECRSVPFWKLDV